MWPQSPVKVADPGASTDADSDEPTYESFKSGAKDARSLVQQKAMFRAQQREYRVAARQWYGYSASRPPVFGNPYFLDVYSPALWHQAGAVHDAYGPYGWYYPRRSLSAYRWAQPTTTAVVR